MNSALGNMFGIRTLETSVRATKDRMAADSYSSRDETVRFTFVRSKRQGDQSNGRGSKKRSMCCPDLNEHHFSAAVLCSLPH
jgi:hypothetical protein